VPAVLSFPVVGGRGSKPEWALTATHVDSLQQAFPGVDVLGECRKAHSWIDANPSRRKTANGMKNFLHGWMSRTNDRGRKPTGMFPAQDPEDAIPPSPPVTDELVRIADPEAWEAAHGQRRTA
jgi:hypothetical protein